MVFLKIVLLTGENVLRVKKKRQSIFSFPSYSAIPPKQDGHKCLSYKNTVIYLFFLVYLWRFFLPYHSPLTFLFSTSLPLLLNGFSFSVYTFGPYLLNGGTNLMASTFGLENSDGPRKIVFLFLYVLYMCRSYENWAKSSHFGLEYSESTADVVSELRNSN